MSSVRDLKLSRHFSLGDLLVEATFPDLAQKLAPPYPTVDNLKRLSALLDGLWLESGLNPGTFTPEQGIQICEAWVDGLQAGGRQRFCVQTSDC